MSELKLQQTRLDGRYDVLECLGRGSYAEIYVARDEAAEAGAPQSVVIKALNVHLQGAVDPELEQTLLDNFRNEAVALDRVRHPHVINRLGHGTAIDLAGQTFHYLVLEYLPGGDVATLCRKHPLPLERVLHYIEQVCAGLEHAHAHGVIHRDIKPQNLLLTADCEIVKIADFGIAKIEALEGAITRVGTDIYAAPEHHPLRATGPLDTAALSNTPHMLTPAADIYSLAKTVYMMLTGEAPRRFSQQPISELPAHVAGESWAGFVLSVLRRATETNPAKRYQRVPEFWAELRDAALPQTRLLTLPNGDETRPLAPLRPVESAQGLPPRPQPVQFAVKEQAQLLPTHAPVRPRIVVPVTVAPAPDVRASAQAVAAPAQQAQSPARVAAARKEVAQPSEPRESFARRMIAGNRLQRWLVVLLFLAGFALLLLGVRHYVANTNNARTPPTAQTPNTNAPPTNVNLQTGREMTTITNVNLRSGPSRTFQKLGEAERGSRVRVLQCNSDNGSWCEVLVLVHGAPRAAESGADQGWLDATKLR